MTLVAPGSVSGRFRSLGAPAAGGSSGKGGSLSPREDHLHFVAFIVFIVFVVFVFQHPRGYFSGLAIERPFNAECLIYRRVVTYPRFGFEVEAAGFLVISFLLIGSRWFRCRWTEWKDMLMLAVTPSSGSSTPSRPMTGEAKNSKFLQAPRSDSAVEPLRDEASVILREGG